MSRWLSNVRAPVFLWAALVLIGPLSAAQRSRLSGNATDFEGKPDAGIKATIMNKAISQALTTTTNTNTAHAQAGLQPGTYAVSFEYASGESYTNSININPGENTLDVNFQEVAAKQATDNQAEKKKQEEAKNYSSLAKAHITNGNNAMQEAQALRKQVDTATGDQRSALLAKMNADYLTAIAEYQQALEDTRIGDESAVKALGLIGVIRNGLVTKEKAVEMLVQDKNLPIILSNLGYAYDGAGEFNEAITALGQAATLRLAAGTYMQLGTDLAQIGKIPEAGAICDKVLAVDPSAKDMQGACYKNIAIVLTNRSKMADAIAPLQKATQLDPNDAVAWKLLGDALSNTISAVQESGKMVYSVPPGTIEAYEKYLQLEPNGPYAAQVKATLEGLARLNKSE